MNISTGLAWSLARVPVPRVIMQGPAQAGRRSCEPEGLERHFTVVGFHFSYRLDSPPEQISPAPADEPLRSRTYEVLSGSIGGAFQVR